MGNTYSMSHPPFFVSEPNLTPSRNKAGLALGEAVVYEFLWVLMIFFDDITQSISTYSSDPFSQQSESRVWENCRL